MENLVIVFGASGDLARKKTFPALFNLFQNNLMESTQIIGYSRTKMDQLEFQSKIREFLPKTEKTNQFFEICLYVSGKYDDEDDFKSLKLSPNKLRVFYLALPPNVFQNCATNVRKHLYGTTNRIIVEKPFGHDLESCKKLNLFLLSIWNESEIYRIDHYLGKEVIKNILTIRFGNILFQKWNKSTIKSVHISLKEKFGTEGRGGYFDSFGMIRDCVQNHLIQILALLAMNEPKSLESNDVRDSKVSILNKVRVLKPEDVILGQYVGNGEKIGYQEDETVPKNSKTATFAAMTMYIDSEEWINVPWFLMAGKALDCSECEVKIQFHETKLFKSNAEMVFRIQPMEKISLKLITRFPGLEQKTTTENLELNYSKFQSRIPDAYESLLYDVLKGEGANFVRSDELDSSWRIFQDVLDLEPEPYVYGSKGPDSYLKFIF